MVIINAEIAKHKTMLTKYFYTSISHLMVLFISSNPNIATVCKLKLQFYRTQFVKKLSLEKPWKFIQNWRLHWGLELLLLV